MDPLPHATPSADERFLHRWQQRMGGAGAVSFCAFMDLALFDPEVGYYAQRHERVGKHPGTDFVTSTTYNSAFGPLVAKAAETISGETTAARRHTFVEIGAEPGRSIFDGMSHPFSAATVVRLGEPIVVPTHAIVFSNELFDAQPFHRLIWRDGAWREQGVELRDGTLAWAELPALSPELDMIAAEFPVSSEDGYVLDVPLPARRLLDDIANARWSGLFIACDYGRTWREICTEYPEGTGRAYAVHRQNSDLLARPGQQDLTCHVCWDWLEGALRQAGFSRVTRESQEAFFVKHAAPAIEGIMRGHPSPLSPARSQLKQLLHPALMGQRFEVLWALRP